MWGFTCNTLVELGYVLVNWIADCSSRFMPLFATVSETQYPHIYCFGRHSCWNKDLLGNALFTSPTRLPINEKTQSLLAFLNYLTPTGPYY